VIFFKLSGYGGEYFVAGGIVPAAVMWVIGAVAMVVGSLMSQPPSDESVARYF